VDPDDLLELLADRLRRIVPEGFHVDASEGMLWYTCDDGRFPGQLNDYRVGRSGTYVRTSFPRHGETLEDHINGVSRQALDELQDYVDEASHGPWPGAQRPPSPHAEIRQGSLHLWFGHDGQVDLACEPIPVDGLG
jgi:hypothetical protein